MSPAELNARLGTAIRQRRILMGLSQDAIGKSIKVAAQQVHKYEKGLNTLTVPRLVQIAEALEMKPEQLMLAAMGEGQTTLDGFSERETMELLKRLAAMTPNQRRGVQLLVRNLAEAV